ncbi:ATP-binding protein [Uliginosibacterium sp. 31-16]|uniref:chemotaxis protein CheA n=1 Tax=Uliginosibacterium sp. 31-16 TaxID=3068315 RepID=UPI00273CF86E|nr:ATP-binding protein [Uliginosibacterium sp. 31-16]MDP5238880.1 ATP-binding protein [Uliginosibacterium sp. 31-16]
MDEAIALFVADCSVRLDELESQLLALEREPQGRSALDAVFRAAHTIKGNATVMQHGEVEWFAHVAESVLARLRDGALQADAGLITVLLACCDHLRFLIGLAGMEAEDSPAFADADRARLIGLLVPYLEGEELHALPAPGLAPARAGAACAEECWRLQLRFAPEVLREGMDPVYFLRHLTSLGRIFSLHTCIDDLPEPPVYNPELCYLQFVVLLDTMADKQAIEDVFSFVRDRCDLQLTPPATRVKGYLGRIQALPDDDLHAGEMLMRVGALTPAELDSGLRTQRSESGERKPLGSILVDEGFVPPEVVTAVLQRQDEIKREQVRVSQQLRVSTEQLDGLIASMGVLQRTIEGLCRRDAPVSGGELASLQNEMTKARKCADSLRCSRFGELSRRLHRVVRDTAQELGKHADLRLSGGEILLDRTVVDLLGDALMHLLRNAIDHGLELPDQRQRVGKPAHGTLSVEAREDFGETGDWLVFAVSDDGAGIDCERVRAVAVAQGLLSDTLRPEAHALYPLLFEPGFSTVGTPTHFSGRGVGLDVVRDAVQALGGTLAVSSAPGLGCRFEIRLPAVFPGGRAQLQASAGTQPVV